MPSLLNLIVSIRLSRVAELMAELNYPTGFNPWNDLIFIPLNPLNLLLPH